MTTPGNEPAIDIAEVKIWNISNYEPPHAVINGVSCGEPNDVIPLDGGQSDGRIRTFLWKVDDEPWVDSGPVFSQEYPAKEGESPYLYKIQLKVIDEFGFTDTTTHNVVIKEARADFRTNEPMTDISPVYFNDLSIPQGCNDIDSWFWEFGDGDFSREENPQHQYSDDGYYAVKLQITSAEVADEITKIIHVENVPPAADFDAKPLVTVVGDFITCNSSSYDCDGKIMSWETDFGDGEKAYIDNSTHNYSESGFYTLKMRVIDDDFDEDLLIKKDHILVADTMVSNDFDSTSNGWNVTHFNDIQKAVDATPRNGILVILDGSYNTGNILVTKPMKIYAIQKGDLPYDYEIEYGGATISYESFVPIFDIATSDIEIRGLTIADGSCGVKSFGDNITLNYCDFIGNEKAIDSISTSNLTIYHCNINSNNIGINLENSEYCFINNCKFNENKYGIKLIDNSNENTISQCIVNNTVNTAILIDESKYNRIESCEIHNSIIGIKINDVSSDVVGENKIKQGKMLNVIENTNFTLTDYGVYIENSSLTRVGTERWSFCGLEGLYPVYYHDSVAGSPVIPRPSNLDEASSLFIDNEFPIFINNSNNNVIDGIAVTEGITSSIGISISSENGVYINNSNGNVIISCLIQHAKHSAINMSYSHENTVCLCMCKENSYGIDIENCYNNLFIACSFFNNTYYGIQMDYCSGVNNVQYNDFINNNLDDSNSQAYDSGEGNNWDDNGHSIWRDLIRENNHEITDNNSKIIGNFWSDYTGGCIENGTGQVPANSDMIDWVPVGITPYYISGLANSRDNGPVLHTIWPYMWYNTDNGGEGYNLPPIPLP